MNFQRIIIIIGIVLLIIALIAVGIALSNTSAAQTWPPIISDCPDYWVDMSGNGAKCSNVKNLGTCTTNPMDFSAAPFNGANGLCAKYTWANTCNVTWDGITSGVPNPCVPPST